METFEEAAIGESDPQLPFLTRQLAEPPDCCGEQLRAAQDFFRNGQFSRAFATIRSYLEQHGFSTKPRFAGDSNKFVIYRKIRGSQKDAASALGVSQSAISQFEKGGRLGFHTLLRAADYFAIPPRDLIIADQAEPSAEILRLDRRRA